MDTKYYVDLVKARLGDDGSIMVESGTEKKLVKIELYTQNQILEYLELSLNRFNLLFDKDYDLESPELNKFADLIVQGVVINGLAAKALVEKGKLHTYIANGVEIIFPDISTTLMEQWKQELEDYNRKINFLHENFRYHLKEPETAPGCY